MSFSPSSGRAFGMLPCASSHTTAEFLQAVGISPQVAAHALWRGTVLAWALPADWGADMPGTANIRLRPHSEGRSDPVASGDGHAQACPVLHNLRC